MVIILGVPIFRIFTVLGALRLKMVAYRVVHITERRYHTMYDIYAQVQTETSNKTK